MRALIPILCVLPLLQGCFLSRSTVNEPIPAAAVAKLVPGQTTAGEAAALLGAPTDVVQLGRRTAWRFDHTYEKVAGLFLVVVGLRGVDTHQDRVWLFFDEQDVLTHVGSTFAADDAEYSLPWSSLDHGAQ